VSLFSKRDWAGATATELMAQRPTQMAGIVAVNADTALRHSAVWACLRLRANLISTMPVDAYRRVQGVQVEVPKPPVLVNPGGERVDILEWLFSSQFDLDETGNTFGLITETDGRGLPARIDLQPVSSVSVRVKAGSLDHYRIGGKEYDPSEVWHERQYTKSGLHVGLSPVAHAAWSIGEYLSIQDFALSWFSGGGVPKALLRNKTQELTNEQAATLQQRHQASMQHGGVLVLGGDWEYEMMGAAQAGADWIEAKRYGVNDIARFFDCPGDVIDAAVSGSSVTYANIVQRNLQLLIHNIGPAVVRRERALSSLLSRPRFVKLNTDALLRMDPKTRAEMLALQITSRQRAPSEARELDNLPPLTDEQVKEFEKLFGTNRDIAETIQKIYLGVGKVITSDEAREIVNEAGGNLPVPGPNFPAAPVAKVV
jgi:HK97 family phage portal protein